MQIRIADGYHDARVRELTLTADYLQKKDEEKEAQREARARQREEERAQREFDREREKLDKERNHVQTALQRLRERGDTQGVLDLESRLADIESALRSVEARAANIRTGYVYVISNVGAFGERMVKIGLTRRLEPLDRIYELSGASVPFRFDVHALIFSDDGVGLETKLHQHFADRRVNQVNTRREFFYVSPAEVRDALQEYVGQHLVEFTDAPEALEWRASGGRPA
ncbi:GIY-YIG nuclease family protein [Kitasatospora sp. NA04385]|uniref:GIY-YIG nuclease family protein n=1 Tax=Kitasatospora sp. NA04385 TaxID=2742135 RepID=UPI0020CB3451|nr:GIY-YIG nuclease family protein [Kitasatospora sp. NA04385]